jgi:hypothetical protein
MVKEAIVGSAIGGLVAGGITLFATGVRGSAAPAQPAPYTAVAAPVQSMTPTVTCAPHQEPVMARVIVSTGAEAATLACVDRAPQTFAAYAPAGMVRQANFVSAETVAPAPVVRTASAPRPRPARQVVYRDPGNDVVRYEPDVRPKGRSVAKTAMIIGGSAGAGAGVGGIVGGKKGALIGAAIGGGAASIYEATKR